MDFSGRENDPANPFMVETYVSGWVQDSVDYQGQEARVCMLWVRWRDEQAAKEFKRGKLPAEKSREEADDDVVAVKFMEPLAERADLGFEEKHIVFRSTTLETLKQDNTSNTCIML
jgi:hypothetical protein